MPYIGRDIESITFNSANNLNVVGNITLSGTVDGRDVAADGTKLDTVATNAIANLSEDTTPQLGGNLDLNTNNVIGTGNINVTGSITGTSFVSTGDMSFTNNSKAKFGTSPSLEIYHDGSNSILDDVGAGNFKMQLAGSDKLEVTSTGVTVTGVVAATSYTGSGANLTGINTDLVSDTSPQLGGDLQSNGHDIVIADTDNIYVGTSNDGLKIHHSNNNSFIEDVGTGNFLITTNGNNIQLMKNQAEQMLVAKTDGAVELYYDNAKKFETTSSGVSVTGGLNTTGNVGIGTASPAKPLTVVGGDFSTVLLDNANASHGTQILFQANGATNSGADIQMSDAGGMKIRTLAVEPLSFHTSASAGSPSERMRLSGSNVLIGKTSEAMATAGSQFRSSGQALDITRDGGSPLNINRLSSSGELVGFFQDTAQFGQITCFTTNSTDYLQIGSSGSNNAGVVFENQRMYPTIAGSASSGTVDLGTSSVRFKNLWLSSNINTSGYVYAAGIAGSSDGNTYVNFPGSDVMQFFTGGSERGRFTTSGFAVGKTSLGDVSAAGAEMNTTGYGMFSRSDNIAIYANRGDTGSVVWFGRAGSNKGDITVSSSGTTFNTTSDIRLKQDIEPLQATDKLMAMNPVSYAWKADPDGPRSMGFIAQEMQEVMPEAVSTGDDEDAMMSMDYGRITPILVSALQDAHRKIEQLESRIAAMEAK